MAIKFACDACGKELAVAKGGDLQYGQKPLGWATISVMPPVKLPHPTPSGPYAYEPLWTLIVCSQPCAEKALDQAKEYLRKKFDT